MSYKLFKRRKRERGKQSGIAKTGTHQVKILHLVKSRFSRALVYTWGTLVAVVLSTNGRPTVQLALLASLSTFLMSLAVYVFNDLADLEVDKINAPDRPLVLRSVSKADTVVLVLLLNFGGMSIGYLLGFYPFLITVGEMILGVAYSVRPFSLKDRFLAKTLAIGAGGILAIIFGGVAAGSVNSLVVYAALLFLIFLFVTSPINDLADYVGDLAQRRKTIPIKIGRQNTVRLALLVAVLPPIPTLILLPAIGLNVLTPTLFLLLTCRSVQLLIPLLKKCSDPKIVREHHEQLIPMHFLLQGALALGTISLHP